MIDITDIFTQTQPVFDLNLVEPLSDVHRESRKRSGQKGLRTSTCFMLMLHVLHGQ